MVQVPIAGGFYVSDSIPLASMEATNLYPQLPQTKLPLSTGALFRTPGIQEIRSSGVTGAGRGSHKFQKKSWYFQVTGNELILRKGITKVASLGTIEGSGQVSFADNGETLCIIVPGIAGYFLDIDSETLTQISNEVFLDFMLQEGGVTAVTEHNNRFVFNTDEEFFTGSLVTTNKGTDFNALDFEDAESANDPIVRVMETANELYVFNTETLEVYKDIGGVDFAYVRVPGATVDTGLTSRFGISPVKQGFYFLGRGESEQPAIFSVISGRSSIVSTPAIDSLIQKYSDVELASVVSWSYGADGAEFIGFNLPNESIVLDTVASKIAGISIWHIRKSDGASYRVNSCRSLFGTTIVDDTIDGRVGSLCRTIGSEYNEDVNRYFSTPYLFKDAKSFVTRMVELSCTRGVGEVLSSPVPENYNPTVELTFSVDQANTFHSLGSTTLGNTGDYDQRQIWRRLGRASSVLVMRFEISSKVLFDIQRLDIEVQ